MNHYRLVHRRGKQVVDEQSESAESPYEAESRCNFDLMPGDTLQVYSDGKLVYCHSVKRRANHYPGRKPGLTC